MFEGAEAGSGSTDLASESPVTCLGMEHVTYFKAEKKDKKGEGRGEKRGNGEGGLERNRRQRGKGWKERKARGRRRKKEGGIK